MSTDNEMDELLRDAGSRWRAADSGSTPTVDFGAVAAPVAEPARRNRWLVAAAAAVVVAGVAVGGTWLGTHRSHGGTEAAGVTSGLIGVDWIITSVELENGDGNALTPGPGAKVHFNSDGTFTGDDGVNSISGSVQIAETTMHFGNASISAVGTTNAHVGKAASSIDSILQGDATWIIQHLPNGDRLVIGHEGIGDVQLTTAPSGVTEAPTHGGLTGVDWKIFEVTTETGNSSDSTGVEGSTAALHINADGSFTGSDGCNPISGTVRITATTLTFSDVYTGTAYCGDPKVSDPAATIDAVLRGQATWSIGDAGGANDLSIEHPGVGSLIYFGDKPASQPVTDPSAVAGTWQLMQYSQSDAGGGGGSASGSGSSSGFGDLLVIDGDGTFNVQHRCYADAGNVLFGDGRATWSDVHLAGSIPCPATVDQQDEQARNQLVDSILKGETTWHIDGSGQLHVAKGRDEIVYSPYASANGGSSAPTDGPTK